MQSLLVPTALGALLLVVSGCDGGAAPSDCAPLGPVTGSYDVRASVTVPEGCYLVEEDLHVSSGAVLRLSPGVILRVAGEVGLEIEADGALRAEGTAGKPILLTGQEAKRGFWNGVTFTNSESEDNVLAWVTIEHAGAKERLDSAAKPLHAGLTLASTGFEVRASLRNTTLRESAGYGLFLAAEAVVPAFTGNTLTHNTTGAAYAYAEAVHGLRCDSTYRGNDVDLVHVDAGGEFGETPRSWDALDVPYRMDAVFILQTSLTLAPGAALRFTEGSGIRVLGDQSALLAEGSAAEPITFSGMDPIAGFWNGLYFANTDDADPERPRSRLKHVVIEHGGAYTFNDSNAEPVNGNLLLDSSGWPVAVMVEETTIRESSGYGLWLDCLATLPGTGITFEHNALGDAGHEDDCN